MAAKITKKLAPPDGVSQASSTITLSLPLGLTYNALAFDVGVTTTDDQSATAKMSVFTKIRLLINGKIIWEATGQELEAQNIYDGIDEALGNLANAGASTWQFPLYFTRPTMRSQGGDELTAIGTSQVQNLDPSSPLYNPVVARTFDLEIETSDQWKSGKMTVYALQAPLRPTGRILKRRRITFPQAPANGVYEIANLPRGDDINRITIAMGGADRLTDVEVEVDNFRYFFRNTAINELFQTAKGKKPSGAIVDDYFILDFTEEDNGLDTLPTAGVEDLRLKLNVAGTAFTPTLLVDYIGYLTGN